MQPYKPRFKRYLGQQAAATHLHTEHRRSDHVWIAGLPSRLGVEVQGVQVTHRLGKRADVLRGDGKIAKPSAMRARPVAFPISTPRGTIFSTKMTIDRMPIHAKFMVPTTNSTAI